MTTSWDQVLNSAGMFKLESYLGNDPVYFSYLKPYYALLPSPTYDPNMSFYKIPSGSGIMNWISDSLGGYFDYNGSQLPYGYFCEYFASNWINCDALPNYPNITVSVTTQNNPNTDSTLTYVWFNSINGIRDLSHVSANLFSSNMMKPVACTLVSITISNGKIYAGFLNVASPTNASAYTVPMNYMTDQAFKDTLATLN